LRIFGRRCVKALRSHQPCTGLLKESRGSAESQSAQWSRH
jgi:hypothetical protein